MRRNKIFILYISWNDLAKKKHVPVKTRFVYSRVHFLKIFFVTPFYYHTNNAGWFLACFSFVVCKERCTAARKLKGFLPYPLRPLAYLSPQFSSYSAFARWPEIRLFFSLLRGCLHGGRKILNILESKVDHPSAICFLYSVYMRKVVLVPRARIFLAER